MMMMMMLRADMRSLLLVTMAVTCTVMFLLYTDLLSFFCPKFSMSDSSFVASTAAISSSSGDLFRLFAVAPSPSKSGRYVFYNSEIDVSEEIDASGESNNLVPELEKVSAASVAGSDEVAVSEQATMDKVSVRRRSSVLLNVSVTNASSTIDEHGEILDSMAITRKPKNAAGCNYYAGKWVKDKRKKLYYSGKACKRWLSEMWACREMPERPTFEYESYRWQPEGCDMPIFSSHDFLARMRNKVVAFVGDSIGRQQFQSLMCMLTGGGGGDDDNGRGAAAEVDDVSSAYGLAKAAGAARPDGVAQRFSATNTTVIYYWSATLCYLEPLPPPPDATAAAGVDRRPPIQQEYAMHLDRPAAFLRKYVGEIDVLVLNTGHHWNRGKMKANGWVTYSGGRPRPGITLGDARRLALRRLAEWLDRRRRRRKAGGQLVYMRTLSPRHFSGGEWDTGGRCDAEGSAAAAEVEEKSVEGKEVRDEAAEAAAAGTGIRLLNITYLSQYRDEAHISKYNSKRIGGGQDCLHWCLPGVPDVWNELLYAEVVAAAAETTVAVAAAVA